MRFKATIQAKLRAVLPLSVLSVLLLMLYFSVIKELVQDWWIDPNYSHGFLIPLIGAYFLWEKREKLKQIFPHLEDILPR